jgi:wyosine [tRNA(Phe)-imidazoG37] synthetase (radical SAM superfamily)
VRILTNASRALRPAVRAALDELDERIVKLDASPERIEKPHRVPLGGLLAGLALLRDFSVQSCFVEGAAANTDAPSIADWIDLLAELRPRAVQIYTIDLPAASTDVLPAAAARLEEIACHLRARTGIEAGVYS